MHRTTIDLLRSLNKYKLTWYVYLSLGLYVNGLEFAVLHRNIFKFKKLSSLEMSI
jgi:hypothetical protein